MVSLDEKDLMQRLDARVRTVSEKEQPQELAIQRIMARSKRFVERMFLFDSVPRLMVIAEEEIRSSTRAGKSFLSCACWWAASLSEARGRMKRRWWSPEGGLYLCLSLFPLLLPENQQLYSLSLGLSACQVLRELGLPAQVRWVNDVMLSGKKVCGILSRTVSTPETGEFYLLFGIGMNVNIPSFPGWLKGSSTSLEIESGKKWDIADIGIRFLSRFVFNLCLLHEWESSCMKEGLPFAESTNPVISAFEALSELQGRRVLYGRDLEKGQGTPFVSRGITGDGSLVLESLGEIIKVNTGEIRFLDQDPHLA